MAQQGQGMIRAAIFDKDGTLFDFAATWGGWTARIIDHLVARGGDRDLLADRLGYDLQTGHFHPQSPVITWTVAELTDLMLGLVPGLDRATLTNTLNDLSANAPQVQVAPLREVFQGLRDRGLKLGLATNDAEAPARAHLAGAGVLDLFDFVAGSDSGHGGKPAPGQLLAFVDQVGVDPAQTVMVGDSLHDLHAGAAAGMRRVAVLTGIAKAPELAPHADAVLADIGHLGRWIDAQG